MQCRHQDTCDLFFTEMSICTTQVLLVQRRIRIKLVTRINVHFLYETPKQLGFPFEKYFLSANSNITPPPLPCLWLAHKASSLLSMHAGPLLWVYHRSFLLVLHYKVLSPNCQNQLTWIMKARWLCQSRVLFLFQLPLFHPHAGQFNSAATTRS